MLNTFIRPLWLPMVLALMIPVSTAGAEDTPLAEYAAVWQLQTPGDNRAWRVELGPEVYRILAHDDARDLLVVNAQGQPVPMFRLPADRLVEQITDHNQPRFEARIPAPRASESAGTGLELEIERPDGTRFRLQAPNAEPGPERLVPVFEALIEAPVIGRQATDRWLQLEWVLDEPPRDDLECLLQDADDPQGRYRLLEVTRRFQTLPVRMHTEIRVPENVRAWFVHCRASSAPVGIALDQVRVETREQRDHNRHFGIEPEIESDEAGRWRFSTRAPYTLQQLEVISRQPGQLSVVELRYRDPRDERWVRHAKTELSTFEDTNRGRVIFDLGRRVPRTNLDWEVMSDPPLDDSTRILLQARAEEWVFLSRGQGPWRLLAGSRRAEPTDPNKLVASALDRIGPAWLIPRARLGRMDQAGGSAALTRPSRPIDWKRIALWSVLLGGALAVSGLALRALRESPDQ